MRALWITLSFVASASLAAPSLHAQTPQTPAGAATPAPATPPAPAGSTGTTQRLDPKGKTGISGYTVKILKGNSAFTSRDFQGAITVYRDAIQDDAKEPLGHYLLGEAQLAAGNLAEAEASWANGLRYAGANDGLQAKLLFVMADLRERQGKWDDAKKAWQDYATFVNAHPNAKGYAATATERNKALDTHVDLETKYAAVRQRIEQRLKENGAPPADDGPQGPAGKKKK